MLYNNSPSDAFKKIFRRSDKITFADYKECEVKVKYFYKTIKNVIVGKNSNSKYQTETK
ncbi:hypothetical protein [Metamycoplasma buccale]|uniref:hypothetical protein n=1 Tax=Metamycoplasma buccale TaxID=55602 RepID=UPI00398F0732